MFARLAAATLAIAVLVPAALPRPPAFAASFEAGPARAAHVLNRLAFGPRPGDVERVQRIGVQAWIEQQLQPSRIDDRQMESRLAAFQTLALDTPTILRDYFAPAVQERRARQRQSRPVRPAPPSLAGPSPSFGAAGSEIRENPENPPSLAVPSSSFGAASPASPAARKARLVLAELSEARILRAVYSEHQLEEVLTDFWFNHFNVFAGKGPTRAFLTSFERDTIRPHVLGDFRQMLEAVAGSPAMLFYLDNWQNGTRGINENFARELLELHTLGADGGYTQDDIVNVARAFTGWTMRPRQDGQFMFVRARHDTNEKRVLGHTLKAGRGIEEGREVLDILVAHPATARFIATRLAQKFVSDTPPPALVERAARRFRDTRGNLREVTREIVTSPEFLAPEAYRAKVKTPLEFVASALRATGADVRTALPVTRTLRDLGMPLYFCQPPSGYDEIADTWVSSGALVARMNFALELGGGRLRGITIPGTTDRLEALRERLIGDALGGEVSAGTRATIAKASTADQVVALIIGSPEFQRQ